MQRVWYVWRLEGSVPHTRSHTDRLRSLEDSCSTSSRHVLLAADMPEDQAADMLY